MYSVTVRDRMMIAHSFKGDVFGPAQRLHGATFVVDAVFMGKTLVPKHDFLIDVCFAEKLVKDSVGLYHNRNLDDVKELEGRNTTMEVMCKAVWDHIAAALQANAANGTEVSSLRVEIQESDVAKASFQDVVTYA
jgi:6-pyruvoyl-tetrahydropterin synthase